RALDRPMTTIDVEAAAVVGELSVARFIDRVEGEENISTVRIEPHVAFEQSVDAADARVAEIAFHQRLRDGIRSLHRGGMARERNGKNGSGERGDFGFHGRNILSI